MIESIRSFTFLFSSQENTQEQEEGTICSYRRGGRIPATVRVSPPAAGIAPPLFSSPNPPTKTAVNYLTRAIRFFHQLEELFSDQSHADGSLAVDQTTVNVDGGSDDSKDVRELDGNLIPLDSDEADSDTIERRSPKVDLDGNPLNKKRKRASSSPSKKPTKGKASKKGKVSNDDMATSIKKLAESLASPIVSVQPMPPADPYANLWKRINALTIPAKDKLEIVAYLSKPDQDIFRSYLNYADETILGEWVISYFESRFQEGGNDGSASAH